MRANYSKLPHEERAAAILAVARQYKAAHKEIVSAQRKEYYQTHKQRERLQTLAWQASQGDYLKHRRENTNRERAYQSYRKWKLAHREEFNASQRSRYDQDIRFKIEKRLRASMSQAVRRSRAQKAGRTLDLIGCTGQFLQGYLEGRFQPGMDWTNIEIDHIRPCYAFDLTDPKQQKKCFHYSNLQPLFKDDNRRKNKYELAA